MYQEYASSRICAIDYLPILKSALKETVLVCKKYNIPFGSTGRHSKDIQKFFYHYCLEKFCTEYKKIPSTYEKVFVIYHLPKHFPFSQKFLDKILNVLPLPWCKVFSFNSPDTELACLKVLNKKTNLQKTVKFADKNSLFLFLKGLQKNKIFSKGTVDYSGYIE